MNSKKLNFKNHRSATLRSMDKKKKVSSTVPTSNKKQVTTKTPDKAVNKTLTATNSTKSGTKPATTAIKPTSNRSHVSNTGLSKGGVKSADKKSRLTTGIHKNQNLKQQKDGMAFEVSLHEDNAGMERPSSAVPSRLQQKHARRRMSTYDSLTEQQRLADERRQVYETERLRRIQDCTRGKHSEDD